MTNIFLFSGFLFVLTSGVAHSSEVKYSNDPSDGSGIGYESVSEALSALKQKESGNVRIQQGWTIINEKNKSSVWSFTPEGHPAHPAAVKRTTFEEDGAVYIKMAILCQSTKLECDKLVEQFQELNERVKQEMQHKQ